MILAVGIGVEIFLYSFQVRNDVYCPFCLAFSLMVITAFIVNYEVPSCWHENRRRIWLYFLGEVNLPMLNIQRLPLLAFSVLGYLAILLTFSGSVTPAYGLDKTSGIPFLGKGTYEVIVFSDYFCPSCRSIDIKAEPLLKELLSAGNVKITFIDVPFTRATPMYTKYYLYSIHVDSSVENVLRIRKILFEAAQVKRIQKEEALAAYLKEQKVSWTIIDEKSIFRLFNVVIKENNIKATPICVIKYPETDIKRYAGMDEIWDGLTKLKEHLKVLR
jgi:thiol:disulfide interchange protein DsbA